MKKLFLIFAFIVNAKAYFINDELVLLDSCSYEQFGYVGTYKGSGKIYKVFFGSKIL